jgi:predicted nucleic acid-binding protein
MRVYIETNFILELVLEQDEHDACDSLLNFASERKIQLVLPSFSLFETLYTMDGKMKAWEQKSYDELRNLLRETSRTRRLEPQATNALTLLAELKTAATAEAEQRLKDVESRLLEHAEQLPLNRDILIEGRRLAGEFGLESADAMVLASVLADPQIGTSSSLFLNRNTKDFDDESITALLREKSCELKGSFRGGLYLIRQELGEVS